jgi:hypothetical protein
MPAYLPFVESLEKEGLAKGIITLKEGIWYSPYKNEDKALDSRGDEQEFDSPPGEEPSNQSAD